MESPLANARIAPPSSRDGLPCRAVSLVGKSPAMESVKSVATTVASRLCTVMILGETGTGKEMVARYIHAHSDRAKKPFIPVDCSAFSASLFESQMFGHLRGAFTGAVTESLGFVRAANGGTLFLDEIGELTLPLQAKLLRVIQERSVVPVGAAHPEPVDIRIVTATHRDLAAMVRAGEFREDLYFRLNVVTTTLPPLRERAEDILPLANHFLRQQAELYEEPMRTFSPRASAALTNYHWPGNVRELANVVESAHVLAQNSEIQLDNLPDHLHRLTPATSHASDLCLADVEKRTIEEALHRTNHCKAAASRLLGINIQRLNRRIQKLNIAGR